MIHVVENQMKFILLNERPRDISLGQLRDKLCCVYQIVNECHSVIILRDEKDPLRFSNYIWLNR